MPYIEESRRKDLNDIVRMMIEYKIKSNGDLNYILYKFCKVNIKPSYNNYKNYLGELQECIEEIRRRILSEYEDKKIKENGDIQSDLPLNSLFE